MAAHDDLFPGMYAKMTRLMASARDDRERELFERQVCEQNPAFTMYYIRRALHDGTSREAEFAASIGRHIPPPPRTAGWLKICVAQGRLL